MNTDLKQAYAQKTEARLNEWQHKIDELKSRASELSADARIKANEQIDKLNDMVSRGKEQLQELNKRSADNWQDIKEKIEGIKEGFNNALKKEE